ncbi:hypothetical protein DFH06DRAFT_1125875 [Mycena polygramma]|nr:hypothetical protein DFH06DRAFT_1125875 [Mycena polygramma]
MTWAHGVGPVERGFEKTLKQRERGFQGQIARSRRGHPHKCGKTFSSRNGGDIDDLRIKSEKNWGWLGEGWRDKRRRKRWLKIGNIVPRSSPFPPTKVEIAGMRPEQNNTRTTIPLSGRHPGKKSKESMKLFGLTKW